MVQYQDIIDNNCKEATVPWWPRYAFHCTDVTNIIGILKTGRLYSRIHAERLHLMANENASRQVINMTNVSGKSFVRFYFRPKTPTYYYNEGFKHPELRYENDSDANIPVPVFLLFDLERLIQMNGVVFSCGPQSGSGTTILSGVDSFSTLPFHNIYSDGFIETEKDIFYRHSEILYPNQFEIDTCLKYIVCRNEIELTTLQNLLLDEVSALFGKYYDKMRVSGRDLFYNNGLYIDDFTADEQTACISFSDTLAKRKYINRYLTEDRKLRPLRGRVEFKWLDGHALRDMKIIDFHVQYENGGSLVFGSFPATDGVRMLSTKIFIEDKLMCYTRTPLNVADLV
ncbi:MAG: DUF4433 domain-containing protein [Lachnospiraceae bacterium]|nr:DUF4433 domain-containing protein [Lachnospiraceae bacterium]